MFVDSGLWYPPSASTEFASFVEASRAMRMGDGPGLVETAIATGSPRWISDVAEALLRRPVESLSRHGIQGALAVPILIGKSVVGVLEFFAANATEPERVVSAGLGDFGEQIGHVMERERAVRTLRQVSSELLAVEEQERQQLAADLHDEVGQLLPLARIRLDSVAAEAPPALAKGLAELGRILDRATEATRTVAFQLSPPSLRDLGLVPAIHWLAEDTAKHHGLKVLVEGDADVSLPEQLRLLLFRIVRELLLNVTRHARASEARVRFARDDHELSIVVSDNGIGFAPPAAGRAPISGRFGLFSIRERLSYVGGRLEIRSVPGNGTTVTVTVPLEPKEIE